MVLSMLLLRQPVVLYCVSVLWRLRIVQTIVQVIAELVKRYCTTVMMFKLCVQ